MKKWNYILLTACLLYDVHMNGVNASESDEFLKEDLARFGSPALKDGEYEIVRIRHRDVASTDGNKKEIRVRRSGEDVTVTFTENSVIRAQAPVFLVWNTAVYRQADTNMITDAIKFYENSTLLMSIAVGIDRFNHMYFIGHISGADIVPLSNRTISSLMKEKPHLMEEPTPIETPPEDFNISDYHILYNPTLPTEDGKIVLPKPPTTRRDSALSSLREPMYPFDTEDNRLRRSTADIIYPDLLLVLDYNLVFTTPYELRFLDLLMYIIHFWNSVNMRFSTLENPKVQLRVAGIVVNMNRTAAHFIQDFVKKGWFNPDKLDIDSMWEAPEFVDSFIPKAMKYDIVVIQTNLQLCEPLKGGDCRTGILGAANQGPQCYHGWTMPTAILTDNRKYSAVHTAAHEIGHILGADHDDPDSEKDCTTDLGYIMAKSRTYTSRSFTWSKCSRKKISESLRKNFGDCMDHDDDKIGHGELIAKLYLPGSKQTHRDQCRMKEYVRECQTPDVCLNLACMKHNGDCENAGAALEGTFCPIGECRNGECSPVGPQRRQ